MSPHEDCTNLRRYHYRQGEGKTISINYFISVSLLQSFIGEDITRQWYHHAIIVYSDVVSDGLFHFITPLRAAYLPPSSLKPIVFLLGNMLVFVHVQSS